METARSVTWSVGSGPAIEAKVPTGSVLCQGASPLKGGGSFHSGPARGIALSGRLRELLRQSARRSCCEPCDISVPRGVLLRQSVRRVAAKCATFRSLAGCCSPSVGPSSCCEVCDISGPRGTQMSLTSPRNERMAAKCCSASQRGEVLLRQVSPARCCSVDRPGVPLRQSAPRVAPRCATFRALAGRKCHSLRPATSGWRRGAALPGQPSAVR